jgi:hypothetical protein
VDLDRRLSRKEARLLVVSMTSFSLGATVAAILVVWPAAVVAALVGVIVLPGCLTYSVVGLVTGPRMRREAKARTTGLDDMPTMSDYWISLLAAFHDARYRSEWRLPARPGFGLALLLAPAGAFIAAGSAWLLLA